MGREIPLSPVLGFLSKWIDVVFRKTLQAYVESLSSECQVFQFKLKASFSPVSS